ncbi:MAG: hypothetical protein U1D55_09920 [Phycisphaerae bacterium]
MNRTRRRLALITLIAAGWLLSDLTAAQTPPPPQPAGGGTAPAVQPPPPAPQPQQPPPESAGPRRGRPPREAPPPVFVRLQVSVHELEIAPEKVAMLDVDALTAKAGTVATLHDALRAIGSSEILYRVEQNADIDFQPDRIKIGGDGAVPVDPSRMGPRNYPRESGNLLVALVRANDEPDDGHAPPVAVSLELSTVTTGDSENLGATFTPRRIEQAFRGPLAFGKPAVMMTLDAASRGASGSAVAYVTRIEIRPAN